MKGRILSGIQPTGNFHIGNYLGALRQWVKLQREYECLFCVVNLHAMTVPFDPRQLREHTYEITAAYLAAGIDPTCCAIFPQSAVSAHTQLGWILGCMTPLGWLNRMTQFKDKAGKHKEMASLGLYGYPALMAADILAYKATHVPVGEDQKQHLELARDLASVFNRFCGEDFFPQPDPLIHTMGARIMSLRDGRTKMSKSDTSDASRLCFKDTDEMLIQKIKKARTDTGVFPHRWSEAEDRPEVRNLITLMAMVTETSPETLCENFGGGDFAPFKKALGDAIVAHFSPIRDAFYRFLDDRSYLDSILNTGAERARGIASTTMYEVFARTGLFA